MRRPKHRSFSQLCPALAFTAPALLSLLVLLLLATACQPGMLTPPRLATTVAPAAVTPTATAAPIVLPAPTATGAAGTPVETPPLTEPNPIISLWVNETSPEHRAALQQMVETFSQANHIDVEIRLVAPALLPRLMETAVLSGTLPDLVLHPVAYSGGWVERGILDTAAANEVIDQLGRDTFDPAALALVTANGQTVAIPSDGYQQLLFYRTDWIEARGLQRPDNYDDMLTFASSIYDREALVSGFVIPTESNLVTTHQAFEHIAAANGCQLIDERGEVLLLEPACREALNFYFNIVHNYSPIGVQTDTSAYNAYLSGRTGMIMGPPSILPKLAGLDNNTPPTCPECAANPAYLAQNSGIVTHLTGRGPLAAPANFGVVTFLGITTAANREAAAAFATYWFSEGYEGWLAVEPERKVPMRRGTAEQPQFFIDTWGRQPLGNSELSLSDIYGEALAAQLSLGVADSSRWGLVQGQGALVSTLYEKLTFSIVLQEMLSGYFNTDQTIIEAYIRVTDLIPNYQYNRELEPMATPGS